MLYSCVKLETNLAIRNCGTVYLQELFVSHLNRGGGEFLSEVRFISAQVPSGKHTKNYGTLRFIVSFPIYSGCSTLGFGNFQVLPTMTIFAMLIGFVFNPIQTVFYCFSYLPKIQDTIWLFNIAMERSTIFNR